VGLEGPGNRGVVLLSGPLKELQRHAPNHRFVSKVGPSEASRNHPSYVLARLEQRDVRPLSRGRDRSYHSGSGGPVDDHVVASQAGVGRGFLCGHRSGTIRRHPAPGP
jgi:hypothetical protein